MSSCYCLADEDELYVTGRRATNTGTAKNIKASLLCQDDISLKLHEVESKTTALPCLILSDGVQMLEHSGWMEGKP